MFILLKTRPLAGVAMRVVMHPKAHVDDHPEPHAMAKFNDKIKALAGTLEFHRATFEVCAAGYLCLFNCMLACALILM
jgi:hypothetical protein